tara:strand:- start:2030 stop:2524 length:495 start_codon:yes stop_codon:yes gene_type:complete
MNLLDKFQEQRDNFNNFTENTNNFVSNIGSFQKNVLLIATGILVILLVIVGILMLNSKKEDFPPHISPCPDYWVSSNFFKDHSDIAYTKITGAGDIKTIIDNIPEGDTHCVNMHDVGKSTCEKNMNFFTDEYEGIDGNCKKREWANSCNLTWDGITNNSELKDC